VIDRLWHPAPRIETADLDLDAEEGFGPRGGRFEREQTVPSRDAELEETDPFVAEGSRDPRREERRPQILRTAEVAASEAPGEHRCGVRQVGLLVVGDRGRTDTEESLKSRRNRSESPR